MIINKIFNIPYLLTALGGDVFAFRNAPGFRFLKNVVLKSSLLCTANSHDLIQNLKQLSPSTNLQYIPVGVDENFFNEKKYDAQLKSDLKITGPFLLAVGRFAEKKGFKYLIEAIPEILNELPDTKLVLVGYGPKEEELKAQVRKLSLQERVIFVGGQSRENLSHYYATADIFIGPSIIAEGGDTEGQPAAFIEAMASKTAIIASDVGGIKDMVESGKTGLLIPQKDPESIASAVITLCKDEGLKQQLEKNGLEHILKVFTWKAVAEQYMEIYKGVDKNM